VYNTSCNPITAIKMWIKRYHSLMEYLIGYNELIMVGRATKGDL